MATPSYLGEPRLVRLGKFLEEIKDGELYVPRFQRPFVWTDEQRLTLIHSVYLGYPIGSVMVWRTQDWKLRTYERLGPLRLPDQASSEQKMRQYLLDGHQRITTLFAALGPGLYEKDALKAAWMDDDGGPRWLVYLDLLENDASANAFRLMRRNGGPVPDTWLCLNILLDSFSLLEFQHNLLAGGASRAIVNRVQSLADAFRNYTIPVIPMATEDLEQVTTYCIRANRGGSQMSEVHIINALTWTSQSDLIERLDEFARSLAAEGWETFDQHMIMNVCKARFGLDIYRASAAELAIALRDNPDALEQARDAIIWAAQILREIAGVAGPSALPYGNQAVLLAEALRVNPTPSDAIKDEIRRWFWLTTLTEYFQSMTGSLFRRAQQHLRELVAGKTTAPAPDLATKIEPSLRFDFRGARSRAIALLLAELGPRSPVDDAPFDATLLLAEHGNDAMVRLISGTKLARESRKLAAGPENRFLLRPRQGTRLEMALLNLADDHAGLARSHAVTPEALSALQAGDEATFLLRRRDALWALERARAEEVGLEYGEPDTT